MTMEEKLDEFIRALRATSGDLRYVGISEYDSPRFAVAKIENWGIEEGEFMNRLMKALRVFNLEQKHIRYTQPRNQDYWQPDYEDPYYEIRIIFKPRPVYINGKGLSART